MERTRKLHTAHSAVAGTRRGVRQYREFAHRLHNRLLPVRHDPTFVSPRHLLSRSLRGNTDRFPTFGQWRSPRGNRAPSGNSKPLRARGTSRASAPEWRDIGGETRSRWTGNRPHTGFGRKHLGGPFVMGRRAAQARIPRQSPLKKSETDRRLKPLLTFFLPDA